MTSLMSTLPCSCLGSNFADALHSNLQPTVPAMQSEASTGTDSGDEASLKALLQKERQLSKQKDAQIQKLEARVKDLEADLEKAQLKVAVKERQDGEVARAQQELLDELKKRKAVQYELISSSQQLLELRDKVYQQEKKLQTLGVRSPTLGKRAVSEGDSYEKVQQAFARQQSDSATLQKQVVAVSSFMRQASDGCWSAPTTTVSTCDGSPKTASPTSPGLGMTSPPRERVVSGVSRASVTVTASRRTTMSATQPSLAPRFVSRQVITMPQAGYRPASPQPAMRV